MFDIYTTIKSLFPRGPIWRPNTVYGGFTQLIQSITDTVEDWLVYFKQVRYLREPYLTPELDTLEREYGIVKNTNITEANRRAYLAAIKYRQDDLQAALDRAGFDLQVVRNDPVLDPANFLTSSYLCYFGDTNAYAGEPTAMAGEIGGFLIVNGDIITPANEIYDLPTDPDTWSFIFWIANCKVDWPLIAEPIAAACESGNLLIYHDYRLGSFDDYSTKNNDGDASITITTNTNGALLTNVADENINVSPHTDLNINTLDHTFGMQVKGVYHDSGITFQALFQMPGVHELNPDLTINSITKTPTFRYSAKLLDNTIGEFWKYGEDLDIVAGTDNDVDRETFGLGYYDASIQFGGAGYKYYQADNNTFADVAEEDIVIELVFKYTGSSTTFFAKYDTTTGPTFDPGYWIYLSTNQLRCYIEDITGTNTVISTAALTANTLYHAMLFIDKSGSAQWYINGVASGSAVSVVGIGSLTHALPFTIGAESDGANICDNELMYCTMWVGSAWLDTHLQSAVAEERFCKLQGIYPQFAAGAATPTTHTRASTAYMRNYNGSEIVLHAVPDNWLRYERIKEGITNMVGYLEESAVTNYCQDSEDLSGASWTNYNLTGVSTDVSEAPNKLVTGDGIIADISSGAHGIYDAVTIGTPAWVTFSGFCKSGDQDWVLLHAFDTINHRCFFDLNNGVLGSESNCTGHIEGPYNNGYYRCSISFYATTNTAFYFMSAEDNNDNQFVGDAVSVNTYIWGSQIEYGQHPTSYIPTSGGTATRAADSLVYATAGNIPATGTQRFVLTSEDTLLKNLIVIDQASYADSIVGKPIYDVREIDYKGHLITVCGNKINIYMGDQCYVVGDLTDNTNYTFIYTLDYDGLLKMYIDGVLQDQILYINEEQSNLGPDLYVGNTAIETGHTSFDGYIATIFELLGLLSDTEIARVEGFMDASYIGSYALRQGLVPSEQLNQFLRLVMRYKPLDSWVGAIVSVE